MGIQKMQEAQGWFYNLFLWKAEGSNSAEKAEAGIKTLGSKAAKVWPRWEK